MKSLTVFAFGIICALVADISSAQAYYPGSQIRKEIRSDRGPLGTLVMPGQIFPFAIPIVPGSPNPVVAALGIFHAGTLARNPYQAAQGVCDVDAPGFVSDATNWLQEAASHIGQFTTREALGVAQWGPKYVILLARLSNGAETSLRHYPLRQISPGRFCLTRDLVADAALLEVAGFLLDGINVPAGPGAPTN